MVGIPPPPPSIIKGGLDFPKIDRVEGGGGGGVGGSKIVLGNGG